MINVIATSAASEENRPDDGAASTARPTRGGPRTIPQRIAGDEGRIGGGEIAVLVAAPKLGEADHIEAARDPAPDDKNRHEQGGMAEGGQRDRASGGAGRHSQKQEDARHPVRQQAERDLEDHIADGERRHEQRARFRREAVAQRVDRQQPHRARLDGAEHEGRGHEAGRLPHIGRERGRGPMGDDGKPASRHERPASRRPRRAGRRRRTAACPHCPRSRV